MVFNRNPVPFPSQKNNSQATPLSLWFVFFMVSLCTLACKPKSVSKTKNIDPAPITAPSFSPSLQTFFSFPAPPTQFTQGGTHPVDFYINFALFHLNQQEISQTQSHFVPEMDIDWKWLENQLQNTRDPIVTAESPYGERIKTQLEIVRQNPWPLYQNIPGFSAVLDFIEGQLRTNKQAIQESFSLDSPNAKSHLTGQQIFTRANRLITLFKTNQIYPYAPFLELCLLYTYLTSFGAPIRFSVGTRDYIWKERAFRDAELAQTMAMMQLSFVLHTNKIFFLPLPPESISGLSPNDLVLLSPIPIFPIELKPATLNNSNSKMMETAFLKQKYGQGIHQLKSALVYGEDVILGQKKLPNLLPDLTTAARSRWVELAKNLMAKWAQILTAVPTQDQKPLSEIVFTLLYKGTSLFHRLGLEVPPASSSDQTVTGCYTSVTPLPTSISQDLTQGRLGWFAALDNLNVSGGGWKPLELLRRPDAQALGQDISSNSCERNTLARYLALYWGRDEASVGRHLNTIAKWDLDNSLKYIQLN